MAQSTSLLHAPASTPHRLNRGVVIVRVVLFLMGFVVAGCTATVDIIEATRPQVLRDVEGYAIASCLTQQSQPYLKDQGDAWASVIVEREKGSLDSMIGVAKQVKREIAKGNSAVIRVEVGPEEDRRLPALYCGEIVDVSAVRTAVQKAVTELDPSYRKESGVE